MRHVPTIGWKVAGGCPTRSLLRSTLSSAAESRVAESGAMAQPAAAIMRSRRDSRFMTTSSFGQTVPGRPRPRARLYKTKALRPSAWRQADVPDDHFAVLGRPNAGELIDGIEHSIGRGGAADRAFSAELVPNLSVMLA